MSWFNVYVEGAKDASAAGVRRLAMVIATRYGLPAAELERRLANGRFRVKANVDEATAHAFAADLEALGAHCTVGAASQTRPPPAVATTSAGDAPSATGPASATAHASAPTYASQPAATPPSASPSEPRPTPSRTATLPFTGLPVRPAAPTGSGLASALADVTFGTGGLGALENATFSLSTLDGHEDPAAPPSALDAREPPRPVAEPWAAPRPAASAPAVPVDLFAPPEAAAPAPLALEVERPRRAAFAPEVAPMLAPAIAPSPPAPPAAYSEADSLLRTRAALATGVVLAIALALLPVHLLAASRERSLFSKVDARVVAAQAEVATMQEWTELDDVRSAASREKRAAHQQIAVQSFLLWLALAGGMTVAWIKYAVPRIAPEP